MSARFALFVIAPVLLVAACDDAGSTTPQSDLAVAALPDLAMPAADMADAGPMCGTAGIYGPQFPMIAPACTSCVQAMCCAERAACTGSADCVAIRTCVEACNVEDFSCQGACLSAHPNGSKPSSD